MAENFTQDLLKRIAAQLTALVGPIVADIVIRVIVHEAKIDLTPEQLAQMQVNRAKALSAREDDKHRAE